MRRRAKRPNVPDVARSGAGRLTRAMQWAGTRPLVLDSLGAGGVALLLSLASAGTSVFTAVVVALQIGALALRRVRPTVCAALVFGLAFTHWLLSALDAGLFDGPLLVSDVAVPMAVYAASAYGPRRTRQAALAVGLLGAVLGGSTQLMDSVSNRADLFAAAFSAAVLAVIIVLAWVWGQWRRTRVAYVESVLDGARRAEAEHEQRVALAASDERARIARELHDVVAHSLAVVVAQADGGRYAAAQDPQAATRALETVAATGRSALTDMRRLLGVLRQEDHVVLAPQPGIDTVPALIAGVPDVELVTDGEPRPVPAGAGLVVHRVVQESLTNVLKHAGPSARTIVTLRWASDCLTVEITDDGRGAAADPSDGAGRGLAGMRERLALQDGRLHAGPGAGGGYRVYAELPI